ncbi:YHS domain-containing protein, partial [Ochrobactrum sp. SFR4]|uniref:YHS domain-containing protein n=1 Tax=Ochrobactrum sp. SFR4 TaxID=2717368 RepID=UPI001C8B5983
MAQTASHTAHAHDAHHGHHHGGHESGNRVKDPVCGMMVDPAADKPHMAYKGHEYHFCSDSCHSKFKA